MANILVIFPGQSEPNLCGKPLSELMRWHEMALKRSGTDK